MNHHEIADVQRKVFGEEGEHVRFAVVEADGERAATNRDGFIDTEIRAIDAHAAIPAESGPGDGAGCEARESARSRARCGQKNERAFAIRETARACGYGEVHHRDPRDFSAIGLRGLIECKIAGECVAGEVQRDVCEFHAQERPGWQDEVARCEDTFIYCTRAGVDLNAGVRRGTERPAGNRDAGRHRKIRCRAVGVDEQRSGAVGYADKIAAAIGKCERRPGDAHFHRAIAAGRGDLFDEECAAYRRAEHRECSGSVDSHERRRNRRVERE